MSTAGVDLTREVLAELQDLLEDHFDSFALVGVGEHDGKSRDAYLFADGQHSGISLGLLHQGRMAIEMAFVRHVRGEEAAVEVEFAAAESAEQAEALMAQGWEKVQGAPGQIPAGFAESGSVFILRRERAS